MDWERVKYFAITIVSGGTKEQLAKQGYFIRPSDENAWELAMSNPRRYSEEEVESDIGVCGPLPPEMLERWL